jgi:hypothetical protein
MNVSCQIKNPKIIVFDLDETLGYFTQVCILWDSIQATNSDPHTHDDSICVNNLQQLLFNDMMNLYPEIIRPDIQTALKYVYDKKNSGECEKMMIYTNNKRNKEWISHISYYFKYLMGVESPNVLFDQLIHAFKINGSIVELSRTTHKKTHVDLISCTKMPFETQICFLDDSLYEKMNHINVYYINFESYIFHLPFSEMIDRFVNNANKSIHVQRILDSCANVHEFTSVVAKRIAKRRFSYVKKQFGEYEMDKIMTKMIVEKLKLFFKISDYGCCGRFVKLYTTKQRTKKKRRINKKNGNKTRKKTNVNILNNK